MTNYDNGRAHEYRTMHRLTADGYTVFRMAGSHSPADVIAIKPGQILFVQCKLNGIIPPAERKELVDLAAILAPWNSLPIVAVGRRRFWRLTGYGPKDREPWTPDEVAA